MPDTDRGLERTRKSSHYVNLVKKSIKHSRGAINHTPTVNYLVFLLLEHIFHTLKESFFILSGIRLEVFTCFQFFKDFFFFLAYLLRCPNIDMHKQISMSVTLKHRQSFSFQTEHFTALCSWFHFNFRFTGHSRHFNGFTQDRIHKIHKCFIMQVFSISS